MQHDVVCFTWRYILLPSMQRNVSIYILLFHFTISKIFIILYSKMLYSTYSNYILPVNILASHSLYRFASKSLPFLGRLPCFTALNVSGCLQWTLPLRAQVFGVNFEVTEHGQIFGALAGAFMCNVWTCLWKFLSNDLDQADRTPEDTTDRGRFFVSVLKR